MSKPKLLDLYCGAGGAAVGYHRAGFDVVGVDIKEQPNYPFEFIQSDVFDLDPEYIKDFDVIHASPPCQAYSWATKWVRNKGTKDYVDLVGKTRAILVTTQLEYIIENVRGAPLSNPLMLCGTMFDGLRVIRHRYFEIGMDVWLYPPRACRHEKPEKGELKSFVTPVNGAGVGDSWRWSEDERKEYREKYRKHVKSKYMCVSGHGADSPSYRFLDWCDAMKIDWMTKYELTQAIPPAYTEWIGGLIIK